MTLLLTHVHVGPVILGIVPSLFPRASLRPLARWDFPALLVALAIGLVSTCWVWGSYGLSLREQLGFILALVGTNLLPGYLLGQVLWVGSSPRPCSSGRGRPHFGAAFVWGLGPQLCGWAAAVAAGVAWLTWVVPISVVLIGALLLYRPGGFTWIPLRLNGFREHNALVAPAGSAGQGRRTFTPPRWWTSFVMLFLWLVVLRSLVAELWSRTPLAGGSLWNQDLYWHLAISADALHHLPPGDPQSAADGTLSYHWFSNAQAAAFTLSSGVDLAKISVLAWFVPVALAGMSLVFSLGRVLSGSGAVSVAAVGVYVGAPAFLALEEFYGGGTSSWYWFSPSHMLAVPVGLLAVLCLVVVVREAATTRPSRRTMLALGYLFLLCPGVKISLLPVLLCGLGAACVGTWLQSRRAGIDIHGAKRHYGLLIVGVLGGVVLLGTQAFFAGGGGGSRLSFGASVGQLTMWQHGGGPGYADTVVMTATIIVVLANYLPYLLVLAAADRSDPAVWFFAGAMLAGLGTLLFLEHPSRSQLYFVRGFIPAASAFLAWGWVVLARRHPRLFGLGLVSSFSAGLWWVRTPSFLSTYRVQASWVVPLAIGLMLVTAVLGWLFVRRREAGVASLLAAVVVGYGFSATAAPVLADPLPAAHETHPSADPASSPDEVSGTEALARANPQGKLIATNVHCQPMATKPHCDARGFWVSARTRSPALVGAWGYASSARKLHGKDGYSYLHQAYPFPQIFRANEDFFAHPDASKAARLRALGVRFVYADARASAWSRRIGTVARTVWISPTVGVFELDR